MLGVVINGIIVIIVNIIIIAIMLIIVVIVITIVSIFFEIVIILNIVITTTLWVNEWIISSSSRKPFPGRHIWFGLLVVGAGDFWYFVNAFFRFGGWCSCGCR